MEGDSKYNSWTMPIAWGVPAAKVFVGVWFVVLIGALIIVQFYVLQIGWWMSAIYYIAVGNHTACMGTAIIL
jgi:4-hydroxybenzoate polyprenyltransferase